METNNKKSKKRTKVLVTGGAGFLGRYIIETLHRKNCDVVAIVKKSTDVSALKGLSVRFVHGDVRDRSILAQGMSGVDAVVHAAATFSGSWDDFHAVNVESTRTLLELAADQKIHRFVFISSVSVYDHVGAEDGFVFNEEMPYQQQQLTSYARSKIEAEQVVQEFQQDHRVPCTVLRPGALYGVGGELYPAQLGLPLGGSRYGLIGDGNSTLPLCHCESVAEAVWLSIRKKQAIGQSYNLVEDQSISRMAYLRQVKKIAIPDLSIVRIPYFFLRAASFGFQVLFKFLGKTAPLRPLYLKTSSTALYFSTDKIKKQLSWQPAVEFDSSLKKLFEWYREKHTPRRNFQIGKGKVSIPSDETVRVGISGCGGISGTHLDILSRIPNADVVAVADPSEEARQKLANKFGVASQYTTIDEMLKHEKLDVVHILTPAQFHCAQAVAAIKKGCHVLVEKPMALNADEAKKMLLAAKRHKTKLCVGHNHLFDDPVIEARKIIASGSLGQITYVESWYGVGLSADGGNRALSYEARNAWFFNMPGSLYQDFISHPLSLLTDVMGEVQVVKSTAKYNRVVPHMTSDELRIMVASDQVMGSLCVSLASSPRKQFLKIYGTKGNLTVDILNKYTFLEPGTGPIPKTIARNLSNIQYGIKLLGAGFKNIFKFSLGKLSLFTGTERMIRLFYRSILFDEPVPVSPKEGLHSMQVMDEIWQQLDSSVWDKVATNGKHKRPQRKKQIVAIE